MAASLRISPLLLSLYNKMLWSECDKSTKYKIEKWKILIMSLMTKVWNKVISLCLFVRLFFVLLSSISSNHIYLKDFWFFFLYKILNAQTLVYCLVMCTKEVCLFVSDLSIRFIVCWHELCLLHSITRKIKL